MIGLRDRAAWNAVARRDRAYDGRFVFAVRTTGVFCRPSCPARRPRRENVTFYATPREARLAGFRPCKRCRPCAPHAPAETLVRRAKAILDRAAQGAERATLRTLAEELAISPFHLQRTFKKACGLSPRAYLDAARANRFCVAARAGQRVLDAAAEAGYGSSRGLYAAAPHVLGMTPAAVAAKGRGERIAFTVVTTAYGFMLVAATDRGVVRVVLGDEARALVLELTRDFGDATLVRDDRGLSAVVRALVRISEGAEEDVPLDLRGTALQLRVWEALRRIPRGETVSYGELARRLGLPRAARAVAGACASNPTALVVPCHRVVGKDGALRGYRWGLDRKAALLAAEQRSERHRSARR